MPIYEFECKKCGETFEALRPVGDTGSKLSCPSCGAKKPVKVFSTFATGSGCAPPSSGFG
jgi:putative FmdB family regulatory protein